MLRPGFLELIVFAAALAVMASPRSLATWSDLLYLRPPPPAVVAL